MFTEHEAPIEVVGDFPRAKSEGNPEDQPCQSEVQPCQPEENPVPPDSFTRIYILFQIGFLTFVCFISYSLPIYNFSPKGELIIDHTQRCVLQTGSTTSHDSMFRWSKCFQETRTKTVLSSHCTYNMYLHISKET